MIPVRRELPERYDLISLSSGLPRSTGNIPKRFRPITGSPGGGIDLSFVRVADDTSGWIARTARAFDR